MPDFDELWAPRKFRGQNGYMFSADPDVRLFMVPYCTSPLHGNVLQKIEIQLLIGPGRKIARVYEYPVRHNAERASKTAKENMVDAAERALTDASFYLRDGEAICKKRADGLDAAIERYRKGDGNT